jgi:hypothetical protein
LVRKFATAAITGVVIAAFSVSATALAAGNEGAAACQPEQGHITAAVAQTGQLGTIISSLAPINQLNQQSLFNC